MELQTIASTVASWAERYPAIKHVYLFGSRVRGDFRPDSDLDIRIEFNYEDTCEVNRIAIEMGPNDLAQLKSLLPLKISVHQDNDDAALPYIKNGETCMKDRKVICILTPPIMRL